MLATAAAEKVLAAENMPFGSERSSCALVSASSSSARPAQRDAARVSVTGGGGEDVDADGSEGDALCTVNSAALCSNSAETPSTSLSRKMRHWKR